MFDLPSIRRALANHPPQSAPADVRQAAVAVVLRENDADLEMLFIKRAERAGDPWSGHMAFPGGHREASDVDLCAAAVRETHEEIGLDLSSAPMLGELPQQHRVDARGGILVAPFVFEIAGDPTLTCNHEVAAATWMPLAPMYRGDNHTRAASSHNGFRLDRDRFVWGMTYRMVQTLFEILDPNYRHAPG